MKKMYSVLFIDDKEINNYLTTAVIDVDELPINPIIHTSPLQALKELSTINDFPTHIFVDVNMPELDGIPFVRKFEETFPQSDTRIYFLSAALHDEIEDEIKNLKSVHGYFEKPFSVKIANEVFGFDQDKEE